MMDVIDIIQDLSPFPLADTHGSFYDGYLYSMPPYCVKRCAKHECLDRSKEDFDHYVCSYGFSCYHFSFCNSDFFIFGLNVVEKNSQLIGQKRKLYKDKKVSESLIIRFHNTLSKLNKYISYLSSLGIKDNISIFHDIKTSLGLVMNSAQSIIDHAPGENFEAKFKNVEPETRNLYLSVSLLNDQLSLVDIIVNPERISFGRKRKTAVYKLFHKIGRLFDDRAAKRSIEIVFGGNSTYQVDAFESIQFLPLILIDNAVKYSLEGKKIFIDINDNPQDKSVEIKVSSYGPIVKPEYADRIFDKYFRGENASFFSSQGNGIGLFLAQEIAQAHGIIINYEAHAHEEKMKILMGRNDFRVSIPCKR